MARRPAQAIADHDRAETLDRKFDLEVAGHGRFETRALALDRAALRLGVSLGAGEIGRLAWRPGCWEGEGPEQAERRHYIRVAMGTGHGAVIVQRAVELEHLQKGADRPVLNLVGARPAVARGELRASRVSRA
jgi:hypothetical protein